MKNQLLVELTDKHGNVKWATAKLTDADMQLTDEQFMERYAKPAIMHLRLEFAALYNSDPKVKIL